MRVDVSVSALGECKHSVLFVQLLFCIEICSSCVINRLLDFEHLEDDDIVAALDVSLQNNLLLTSLLDLVSL